MGDQSITQGVVALTTASGLDLWTRPLRAADRHLLVQGFDELSNEGRYKRFFGAMPELKAPMLDQLTQVDQCDHLALGALDPHRDIELGGHPVAVVRAIRSERPSHAELAVTVVDDYQRQGVGAALIAALAAVAPSRGIDVFDADMLATNRAMKALMRRLGGTINGVDGDRTIVRANLDCATAASSLPADTQAALQHLFAE